MPQDMEADMPNEISYAEPLTSFFDRDPAGWKPFWYTGYVDLGVDANSRAVTTISLQFQPFMWIEVAHGIVGNIDDWETSGLNNDGQYLISISDERQVYTQTPTPANHLFGPHKTGEFAPLPIPVFFPANHTIRVGFENIYDRTLTPVSPTFRVYITLRGMHYWGQLKYSAEDMAMSMGGQRRQ
jgi:hypothetical protein